MGAVQIGFSLFPEGGMVFPAQIAEYLNRLEDVCSDSFSVSRNHYTPSCGFDPRLRYHLRHARLNTKLSCESHGCEVLRLFFTKNILIMKKILKPIAAFLCIGAIMFLAGGDFDEETPKDKAMLLNTGAIVTALVSGLYLKKIENNESE